MMKMKWGAMAALSLSALLSACSDDDSVMNPTPTPDPEQPGTVEKVSAYVIASQTAGASGTAAYLVTAPSLESGMVTTIGNGFETDYTSATTWIFFGNDYLYRLAYNYGSAGTTAAYYLDAEGNIRQRAKEYNILNFTTYGIYGNKIIAADASSATDTKDEAGNAAYGIHFSIIDVEAETTGTKTLISEDFLGNKERVMFSGLLEANGKLYTAVVPLGLSPYGVAAGGVLPGNEDLVATESGGSGGGQYESGTLTNTQYPDECWVAIFDNEKLEGKKLIKTDKISYACGRYRSQYYQSIWAADNGDIYIFSPSYAKTLTDARQQTKLDAGVVRIKAGATDFDPNYYYSLEAQSGGKSFLRCWHAGGNYFLLRMYDRPFSEKGYVATELAIFNGDTGKLTFVSGLPATDKITDFGKMPYVEGGYIYMPVMTSDSYPAIYKIDPATATATKGLSVEVTTVTAVGKMKE